MHVEPLRLGRTVSTVSVRIVQETGSGAAERVRFVGTFGDVARTEPVRRSPAAPSMPPPDECLPARRDASPVAQGIVMLDRLDVRVDPATAGFAIGRPSRRGVIRAWLRMADGREPDVAMLPYAVDALMPVSFDLGVPGWAPTLELTGQVLGTPSAGWLAVELTHRHRRRRPRRRGRLRVGLVGAARGPVPPARLGALPVRRRWRGGAAGGWLGSPA